MTTPEPKKTLTTTAGIPVGDNQNSLTAGPRGPVLMQDFHLIEKMAHFNRERIPERVVHAKGAGAFGTFTVTNDITRFTKAHLFSKVGKHTEVLARFSTVGGEKGSADSARDPRGFALKFYTEEGNWDLVGNNTPVFFVRDPLKFGDFIHTQKRDPQTNLKPPRMMWDFFSRSPESLHQVTILFSDRGTPKSHRHMHGFSSHTFSLINAAGARFWVKFHCLTRQGIENNTSAEAIRLAGADPDHATADLFDAIARGDHPKWRVCVQIMPEADAATGSASITNRCRSTDRMRRRHTPTTVTAPCALTTTGAVRQTMSPTALVVRLRIPGFASHHSRSLAMRTATITMRGMTTIRRPAIYSA